MWRISEENLLLSHREKRKKPRTEKSSRFHVCKESCQTSEHPHKHHITLAALPLQSRTLGSKIHSEEHSYTYSTNKIAWEKCLPAKVRLSTPEQTQLSSKEGRWTQPLCLFIAACGWLAALRMKDISEFENYQRSGCICLPWWYDVLLYFLTYAYFDFFGQLIISFSEHE